MRGGEQLYQPNADVRVPSAGVQRQGCLREHEVPEKAVSGCKTATSRGSGLGVGGESLDQEGQLLYRVRRRAHHDGGVQEQDEEEPGVQGRELLLPHHRQQQDDRCGSQGERGPVHEPQL